MTHGHVTVQRCTVAWSHDVHHCKLTKLISVNMWCITTVLIIKNAGAMPKSQNVKDSSRANKYLRNPRLKMRPRLTFCTSCSSYLNVALITVHHLYSVAVLCYRAVKLLAFGRINLLTNSLHKTCTYIMLRGKSTSTEYYPLVSK